jgi:hypothetical protein
MGMWVSRISITQIPKQIETEKKQDYWKQEPVSIKKTFLINPFSDQTVYGLEIGVKNDFTMTFFLGDDDNDDKRQVFTKGFSFLQHLESKFPGLAADLKIIPNVDVDIPETSLLYELILPSNLTTFNIIRNIAQLHKQKRVGDVTFYFLWQRNDAISRFAGIYDGLFREYYKFKILVRVDPFKEFMSTPSKLDVVIKGMLDHLTFDIKNVESKRARFERRSRGLYYSIFDSSVMASNPDKVFTGRFYCKFYHEISEEARFKFISPSMIDFSFPDNFPIPRANTLQMFNYHYPKASIHDRDYIYLGHIINQGVLVQNPVLVPINHFGRSAFIGGNQGTGKTRLLGQITREFYEKAPQVGILYLNVGKANQEHLYSHDKVIKYGDPEFRVPYFVKGEYLSRSIQQTASYLTAALGLREPVDKVIKGVMHSFIKHHGTLPLSLNTLFRGLKKWYRHHPYDPKFQTRILTAIGNRVLPLLSDPFLNTSMKLLSSGVPRWFQEWRSGKKVFLDFSMCDEYTKLLLSSAIFQMICTLTPDVEGNVLQHLIVIDEAHAILEKYSSQDVNSDLFIAKTQLEKIFNSLIREFRSKGLGIILSDVTPSNLFTAATERPSIKILFCLNETSIGRFTHMMDDHKYLLLLRHRHALVLDGNNENRYSMKTATIETKALPNMSNKQKQPGILSDR